MKELDGVCEECGNTGIVGEPCSFCGTRITSLDEKLDEFESDETAAVITPKKSPRKPESDELDEFGDDLEDIDEDLEDVDEDDLGDAASLEDLAEKEEEEDEEGDLRRINERADNDEETP